MVDRLLLFPIYPAGKRKQQGSEGERQRFRSYPWAAKPDTDQVQLGVAAPWLDRVLGQDEVATKNAALAACIVIKS